MALVMVQLLEMAVVAVAGADPLLVQIAALAVAVAVDAVCLGDVLATRAADAALVAVVQQQAAAATAVVELVATVVRLLTVAAAAVLPFKPLRLAFGFPIKFSNRFLTKSRCSVKSHRLTLTT
jgi:hypothetical protein